jgi:C4-type Zn-finger protein
MRVYCPYCRKEVEYKTEKREIKEFKGVEINTYENVAVCKECNQDLYVNKIENENIERIYKLYKEKQTK